MKIAISSSNGKEVDLHLGKSSSVYIYEFYEEEGKSELLEHKNIEIDLESKHQSQKVIKALEDCDVIISVKHGTKSSIFAKEFNTKLVEDTGLVEEVLKRYTDHILFMKNLKI